MPNRPPTHKPVPSSGKADRPSASKLGYGRTWQRVRLYYLAGHPLCELCNKRGELTPATQVHHLVIPIGEDGHSREDNLQALCASCHSKETRREQAPLRRV